MSTYLSIDLDFWNVYRNYKHLYKFLTLAKNSCPNIRIVDSHEEIIEHVNVSRCTNLINVDFHSDISDHHGGNRDHLNCGTWVNYINLRFRGNYTWIHPHLDEEDIAEGYCHVNLNPFEVPRVSGWNKVIKIATHSPERKIDWGDISGIGIAFSYAWLRKGKKDRIIDEAGRILNTIPKVNRYALIHPCSGSYANELY
jgi:hypothetical protein